jgi:fructose-1,6-bisphosphatase
MKLCSLIRLKHLLTVPKKQKHFYSGKKKNGELSSQRVLNENVSGMVKRFKIIADRYRNRGS